jgi:uncharacterized protein YwqG
MTEYEELSEKLEQAGLSRWREYLLRLAKPSILIHNRVVEEDNLPIGISKFGGSMDLPADVDWPTYKGRPLWPMAQFWMPEVAPYDMEGVLPHSGMLYFFYDMVDQPWGYDPSDRGAWKVIYAEVERTELIRVRPGISMPEGYDISDIPVCTLDFTSELTIPSPWADEILDLLGDEDEDNYWNLTNPLSDKSAVHRLLGYPNQIQGDMDVEAQLVSNGIYMGNIVDWDDPVVKSLLGGVKDWRLLFQMDDEFDSIQRFGGDGARIYYWIRKEDLSRRNFDNVWLAYQCT